MITNEPVRPASNADTAQTGWPGGEGLELGLEPATGPLSAPFGNHTFGTTTVDLPPATLTVFVAGRPAPQGSKRGFVTANRKVAMVESSKAVKPWREDVRQALLEEGHPRATFTGAVQVTLTFVMPRPKSLPKTRATPPHTKKPDSDKLVRAVFDAVTSAGVWNDDAQVTHHEVTKRYAELDETAGCHITIQDAR